jgi:uncharacterized repeat protein (TIGR01451 family)
MAGQPGVLKNKRLSLVVIAAVFLASVTAAEAASDPAGQTTLQVALTGGNPANGYATLSSSTPQETRVVRDGAAEGDSRFPSAPSGRAQRRKSLNYFAQLTDFQLADEESPTRVEFTDKDPSGTAKGAWRPQEALQPFVIEYSLRQVNLFADASPVTQGDGSRAKMDFALMTGDQADNMQQNEIDWTRELLEGGASVSFNSGSTNSADYNPVLHPSCATDPATVDALKAEAPKYTGVQDYRDTGANTDFYDPNNVQGSWATKGWPTYTGLMDRAQQSFDLQGLRVPSYVTNGNHDALVQGNAAATRSYEDIATGCRKVLASTQAPSPTSGDGPDPSPLLAPASQSILVPPDSRRQFVNRQQIKQRYGVGGVLGDHNDAHGYDFVDPAQNTASNGAASYYAWDPPQASGFRYISIDTNSEGGIVAESSEGNVDDPQWRWLEGELNKADQQDKPVVVFGHHPIRSLKSRIADEAAPDCTTNDSHGHDVNPGCDSDPRASTPVHLGEPSLRPPGDTTETLAELFARHAHVIAYVPGHTHQHKILPCGMTTGACLPGHAWWELNTSATADWPTQHRLIEVMDNRDGTLSIFGTVLDSAAAARAPCAASRGCDASNFDANQLASIAREFAYNDPQEGPDGSEGAPKDRNVELLIEDPRKGDVSLTKSDSPDPVHIGKTLTYTLNVAYEGGSQAGNVRVTDLLPTEVAYQSATASQGTCSFSAGRVTCSLGALSGGQTATVRIVVKPKKKGTATNTASVSSALTPDRNPANDSASATTVVTP